MSRSNPARLVHLVVAIFLLLCLVPAALGGLETARTARAATGAARAADAPTDTATMTASPSNTASPSSTTSTTSTPTATASATATPSMTLTPTATPPGPIVVTVTPSTVAAGSQVGVTGSGFAPGETVQILLAANGAGTGSLLLANAQTSTAGDFTSNNLTIPIGVPAGAYKILVLGLSSARSAGANLQVTAPQATLTVTPTTFSPTDTITISGANFAPGENVTFSLSTSNGTAAIPLGQAQADASGKVSITPRVPFGVPAGSLQVVATGQTSNRQATANVTVNAPSPTLSAGASTANPGQTVSVTGTHFQPGETVNVDLVSLFTTTRVGSAQADAGGSFTISSLTIPNNAAQGTATLVATGATSRLSATTKITIGAPPAGLTLTNATVIAGTQVGLSGTGFVPGETVTVQITHPGMTPITVAAAVVGTNGSFSVSNLTIPAYLAAGAYTVAVAGQSSGRTATTNLTIQAPPPAAPILSIIGTTPPNGGPYQVSPGALLQVGGSNFPANTAVVLVLSTPAAAIALGTATSNGSGAFGPIGVTIPAAVAPGTYSLQARVGGNSVASLQVRVVNLVPHFTLSTSSLTPGQVVTISGSGYAPGEQVVLALNGAALATIPTTVLARPNGSFTASFIVPATINNGPNTLSASGASSRATYALVVAGHQVVASRFYFPNGDTTGTQRTVISLLNPTASSASVRMIFLYQAAPQRAYTQSLPAHTSATVDLALVAGIGRHISVIVESSVSIGAQSTVYFGNGDIDSTLGATAPGTTWYLAEGYTGGSFREFLEIMNPNSGVASVDVRFLPFNGRPPQEVRFSVGPNSNIRLDTSRYMPRQSFSTLVTSDRGVVVERTMRFGRNGRGAHDKIGIALASPVWLFPQVATAGNRQAFLTILNPNQATAAAVTATFFDVNGRPVGSRTIQVDPLRRGNIKINDVLSGAEVATVVTSTIPVVVERPLYDGPPNLDLAVAGSDIFGRNGGGISWLIPGGSTTGGNRVQLLFFNPGIRPAAVTATFYTNTGATVSQSLTLGPNSSASLPVNGVMGNAAFGVALRSTNGQAFVVDQQTLNTALGYLDSTEGFIQ